MQMIRHSAHTRLSRRSLKCREAPHVFDAADHRFDDSLAHAIQCAAGLSGQFRAHVLRNRIVGHLLRLAGMPRDSSIRRNQHLATSADRLLHGFRIPVPGIGRDHLRPLTGVPKS